MSRLEAIAIGLYYATPEPVVRAIARYVRLPSIPAAPSARATNPFPIRLLDPCAGKGRALALLADTLRAQVLGEERSATTRQGQSLPALDLYGIEPNADRAQEASERIPNLLVTSYFTATLSEGGFQLAFVNPPYDHESDADADAAAAATLVGATAGSGKHERLELRFLRRTTAKLAPDGVLVWIVPQVRLRDSAKHLAEHYANVRCWRFPDDPWRSPDASEDRPEVPMYAAFSQVVLLARRRRVPIPADEATLHRIEGWATMGASLAPLPLISTGQSEEHGGSPKGPESDDHRPLSFSAAADAAMSASPISSISPPPTYLIPPALQPLRYFLATTFDPDAVARQLTRPGAGVWSERGYVERHWPDLDASDLGIGRPLAPLRRGHLALLAAAGIANGQELVGTDGCRLVVKGACRKVTTREETREPDPESGRTVTTVTETDHFEVALWAIDLDTGEVIHIG